MKSTERHKLKQNEFARSLARARDVVERRGADVAKLVVALIVVAAIAGGYVWWRNAAEARANAELASAMAIYQRPVVPPPPPEPGSPPPVPQPGTFQTEQERYDASLPALLAVADAHPGRDAGTTARFHAAGIYAATGRHGEAETGFAQVAERAGSWIYGRTARMGLAEAKVAQGKFDEAIEIYTELARETNPVLPLDGVLVHLGRACARAGRTDEAVRAFTRLVDEFPQSPYAADARRELEEARRQPGGTTPS